MPFTTDSSGFFSMGSAYEVKSKKMKASETAMASRFGSCQPAMTIPQQNMFDKLPIEINQRIGLYLDVDQDISSFRLACRSTHDAIDGDYFSFWRRRFLTIFEKPYWKTGGNLRYREMYQKRRRVLKRGAQFRVGESPEGRVRVCLEVVRDLIVEAFSEKEGNTSELIYASANMELIRKFVISTDLLKTVLESKRSTHRWSAETRELLFAVQVILAPELLSFNPHMVNDHISFPESQEVVYATKIEQPMLGGCNGLEINMEWLLHQINFWKYHMIRREELTLFQAFSELDDDERPRFWSEQLKQGETKLGKHWKGCYAFVERLDLSRIREGKADVYGVQDIFNGEQQSEAFQDMRLRSVDPSNVAWPEEFERVLQSLTAPPSFAKTRAQKRSVTPDGLVDFKPRSFQFVGDGHDLWEDFLAQGWLNALPPQHDIPGWQRMTMMKYFVDSDSGATDWNSLWAYEGVVLPGGQIMIGRWWSADNSAADDFYSGPFILWCVDGPKNQDSDEV